MPNEVRVMPVDAKWVLKGGDAMAEWTTQEIMDHQVAHNMLCDLANDDKNGGYNPNVESQVSPNSPVVKKELPSPIRWTQVSPDLTDLPMQNKKKNLQAQRNSKTKKEHDEYWFIFSKTEVTLWRHVLGHKIIPPEKLVRFQDALIALPRNKWTTDHRKAPGASELKPKCLVFGLQHHKALVSI